MDLSFMNMGIEYGKALYKMSAARAHNRDNASCLKSMKISSEQKLFNKRRNLKSSHNFIILCYVLLENMRLRIFNTVLCPNNNCTPTKIALLT